MLRPPRRLLPLILVAALALGGCARLSESRLNPLNWFSGGGAFSAGAVAADGTVRPLVPENRVVAVTDARVLVTEIVDVALERTGDGAILRATGVAATQGFFNAELVPVMQEGGLVTYEFRVEAPPGVAAQGSRASRTITVAEALSVAEFAAISQIRVLGAANSRTIAN